ncbi:RNA polymerase II subunit A C-terminal domain phosphatase isoform X3 [Cololabis saira]|nr:RNA polymerase II subunit A C-terminal domain phosphatase isoform X3 [Cololabis saira]
MSNKGIFHFQLGRGEPMLHTRLRPHCKEFLEKTAKLYELHVFTFGSRLYAHTIAGFLDPEKKLFSHRILSRDECIDPFSKTGNLRNLFPCGDSMVCIIDDREDVWKFAPNLITVKKYTYFQGTGDINAPPGSRDAQTARKGSSETAGPPGGDEQNNGLRKKAKEPPGKEDDPGPGPEPGGRPEDPLRGDKSVEEEEEEEGTRTAGETEEGTRTAGETEGGTRTAGETEEGNRTAGETEEGTRTVGETEEGTRTAGETEEGTRTAGEREEGTRTAVETEEGTRAAGETEEGTRTAGERKEGTRTAVETEEGTRTAGETEEGTRAAGETEEGSRAAGETEEGTRTAGETEEGTRTAGETEEGTRTAGETEEGTRTAGESGKSSANSGESNNLDFELSSDSDGEATAKPPSPDGAGDGGSRPTGGSGPDGGDGEGDSAAAEPSAILPPDSELGNGSLDRREPETESQNSEQSGVTTGEELLDQSMEDEEDLDLDQDQDDHLIYLEEVLARIHAEYYARYDAFLRRETPDSPDIRRIVPELKGRTLADATVVFSGLYPTNYPLERTREFYHAKALGARIGRSLALNAHDPHRTSHLIAARAGTEKVRQAQGCRNLHVVNPDWLWSCLERWERVEEQLYPLKEDYRLRSSSPASFPDGPGSLSRPAPPSAPVAPRPAPAAPESRTYDPVTGKLIRRSPRGPQGPHQPSPAYQEQPGPRSQQGEAAGSSSNPDGDQPGPSRRKRQPSMSESLPLYTLCKEDLDSMDKEVDDMLGEESDNEAEDPGKEVPGPEEQQPGPGPGPRPGPGPGPGPGLVPPVPAVKQAPQTSSVQSGPVQRVPRGVKRKLDEVKVEETEEKKEKEKEEKKKEEKESSSADESSRDSNEDEGGSSSEADEMLAALEAELEDFM